MPEKNDSTYVLTLTQLKNCKGFLDLLKVKLAVVNPDLDLSWTNKLPSEGKKGIREAKGKCHHYFFGKQDPCDGCPVNGPSPSSLVRVADHAFVTDCHPMAGNAGILVVHWDVTPVIRDRDKLEDILRGLPVGAVLTDGDLHVEYASPAFYTLFPFIHADIIGKDLRLVISRHSPPFPKELLDFTFKRLKMDKGSDPRFDFTLQTPNPSHFEISCPEQSFRSDNPEERRLFIFLDRTRETIQRRIQQTIEVQAEVNSLFREIYRNLHPGLREIKAMTSEIKSKDKALESVIQPIQKKVNRLLFALEGLKKFSRSQTLTEINLNRLLREILKTLNPSFEKEGIRVKTDFTRHIKSSFFDRKAFETGLETILENSIRNVKAIKASAASAAFIPLIELRTRMHGETIELQIRDNVPGTGTEPPETLQGFQWLIQGMGGEFTYHSVRKAGTRVTIRIPALASDSITRRQPEDVKEVQASKEREKKQKKARNSIFGDQEIWILGPRDFATETIQNFTAKHGAWPKIMETPVAFLEGLKTSALPACLVLNISDEKSALPFVTLLKEKNCLSKTVFVIPQELLPVFKRKLKGVERLKFVGKPFALEALMESLTRCLSDAANRDP